MKKRSAGGYLYKISKCLLPALIVLITLIVLFAINGIAPFGNNTVAIDDAILQYADFFGWYKEVLQGRSSIAWTYTKQLGGNAFAIFSYYLSSPFSLLVLFFDKSDYHSLFSLMVICKLTLAAITSYLFFAYKLKVKKILSKEYWLAAIFAVSYAISTYSMQQMCNIMWLDGVYMLPLVLMAVSKIVHSKKPKTITVLAITAGLSIIFNWYSGLINLLFAGAWSIIECVLHYADVKNFKKVFKKKILPKASRALIGAVLGFLIAICIIAPTYGALGEGGRGLLDMSSFKIEMLGAPISSLKNYLPGITSSKGILIIYCGSIPLLVFITAFLSKKITKKRRIIYAAIITSLIFLYYFSPTHLIFSLLKTDATYWVRYSYGIILALIAIAIYLIKTEELNYKKLPIAACIFFALIVFTQESHNNDLSYTYLEELQQQGKVLIYAIWLVPLSLFLLYAKSKKTPCVLICITTIVLLELIYSANTILNQKTSSDTYVGYTSTVQAQINNIKEFDNETYRISQNNTFAANPQAQIGGNLNESMNYNFWGVAGYTSSPDDKQRNFLDYLGYRKVHANITIAENPLISSAALLGVKYITSNYQDQNLIRQYDIQPANEDIAVYENNFALPLAFTIKNNPTSIGEGLNTFEYQNQLYNQLSGSDLRIYQKLEHKQNVISTSVAYILDKNLNYNEATIFADLNYDDLSEFSSDIIVNPDSYYSSAITTESGEFISYYGTLGSPSIIRIKSPTTYSQFTSTAVHFDSLPQADFYIANYENLKTITDSIRQNNHVTKYTISDSETNFETYSPTSEYLFTTIPYQKGTTIYNNGKLSEYELFEDTLIIVPLQAGENKITIRHQIPHFGLYVIISLLATATAIAYPIYLQKHQ